MSLLFVMCSSSECSAGCFDRVEGNGWRVRLSLALQWFDQCSVSRLTLLREPYRAI
jgi:hypothetical protein